eukprot:gene12692-biopygen5651
MSTGDSADALMKLYGCVGRAGRFPLCCALYNEETGEMACSPRGLQFPLPVRRQVSTDSRCLQGVTGQPLHLSSRLRLGAPSVRSRLLTPHPASFPRLVSQAWPGCKSGGRGLAWAPAKGARGVAKEVRASSPCIPASFPFDSSLCDADADGSTIGWLRDGTSGALLDAGFSLLLLRTVAELDPVLATSGSGSSALDSGCPVLDPVFWFWIRPSGFAGFPVSRFIPGSLPVHSRSSDFLGALSNPVLQQCAVRHRPALRHRDRRADGARHLS